MIKLGLEKEVKSLIRKYNWIPSIQTIGYQEWKACLEGKITKEEVKNLINLHTNQFAKRQLTWFKKDKRIDLYLSSELQSSQFSTLFNVILKIERHHHAKTHRT